MQAQLIISSLLLGGSLVAGSTLARAQTPLTIASNGQSAYSILRAPNAPESVKTAAQDLQNYIQKSTKVKLPLLSQLNAPATPFISVGDTGAARAAGLSAQPIAFGGYRIVTRGNNLFILGPDTLDGQKTKEGGTSTGTSNGVYTFLEDYLNIRWLMPGAMGEDVPSLAAVAVPSVDRTEVPVFQSRQVTHLQGGPEVEQWSRRQKMGFSLLLRHNHNWAPVIKPELFATHPEWFPEINGKRLAPDHQRYKIETTNPELVKYFANEVIKAFRADPDLYMFSLSPSDGSSDAGAAWSKSKETLALLEIDPLGRSSQTKLMLKFYNEIARIVGKEFPDRRVGGYIYSTYLYPPKDGVGPLEPNLYLTIAMSPSYGYKGHRPQVKEVWDSLMKTWTSQTQNVGYYDLFTWLRFNGAALTPPAPEIMNFVFPRLAQYQVKATYIYGTEDWAHAGPTNYTLARMTWNPKLDAREVNNEFYRRGFGEAAAPQMRQLYELVDAAVKKHYLENNRASFNLTPAYMKDVLAVNYPKIEELYLAAQKASANATPEQKARLNFFGDDLILVQHRLRKMGAIAENLNSPLYRSEEVIRKMAGSVHPGFGVKLAPGYDPSRDEYAPPKPANDGLRVRPATAPPAPRDAGQPAPQGPINADGF